MGLLELGDSFFFFASVQVSNVAACDLDIDEFWL